MDVHTELYLVVTGLNYNHKHRYSCICIQLVCSRLFLCHHYQEVITHLLVRARTGGQMLITENNACGLYRLEQVP